MSSFKSVKVIDSGKAVLVTRKDGSSLRYHSTWLRDNANDPKNREKMGCSYSYSVGIHKKRIRF